MTQSLEQEIRTLRALFWSDRDPDGRGFAPLADAYRRSGDVRQALEILKDGLERHPQFSPGHVVAARLYVEQGLHAEGELAAMQALDLDPENVDALGSVVRALDGQGKGREALDFRDQLARLTPSRSPEPEVSVADDLPSFADDDFDEPVVESTTAAAITEPAADDEPVAMESEPDLSAADVALVGDEVPAGEPDIATVEAGVEDAEAWMEEASGAAEAAEEDDFVATDGLSVFDTGVLAEEEPATAETVDFVEEAVTDLGVLAPDEPDVVDEPVMDLGALAPDVAEVADEPVMDLDALAPDEPVMDLGALAPDEPEIADEPVMELDALAPDESVMDLGALAPDEPVMELDALAPDEPVMELGALAPDEPEVADESVMDLGALAPDEPVMDLGALAPDEAEVADEPVMELDALAPDEPVMDLGALAPDEPETVDEPVMDLGALAPDEPVMDLGALAPDEPETVDEPVMDLGALAPDEPVMDLGALAPDEPETVHEPVMDLDALAPDEPVVDLGALAPDEPEALAEPVMDLDALAPDEPTVAVAEPELDAFWAPDPPDEVEPSVEAPPEPTHEEPTHEAAAGVSALTTDELEAEPDYEGDSPQIQTRTMAELYVTQGLTYRAIDVYRQLSDAEPDNTDLADRLSELEAEMAAARTETTTDVPAEPVVHEEMVEAAARDLAEGGTHADEVNTPFAWTEDEAGGVEASGDGPTMQDFFDGLLQRGGDEDPS